jgi:hypothetical protein
MTPKERAQWIVDHYRHIGPEDSQAIMSDIEKSIEAEREASAVPILALQIILSRQRAIRGLPDFDEKVFSIAYFALNHLGKLDQEPDPKAVERILSATRPI